MARKAKKKRSVSLFPFLSILACLIGTLTLMITAMALGQMDTDKMADAERYEKIKRRIEEEVRRIEQLEAELSKIEENASQAARDLAQARLHLEELKRRKELLFEELDQMKGKKEEIDVPIVDAAKHKKRMDELKAELDHAQEELEKLRAEWARHGNPDAVEVVIQPGGSGLDLEPTFVECTATGLVLYDGDATARVRKADLATDENFLGLLRRVAQKPKAAVIFLVREDALGTYFAARAVAADHYARNGKLPVVGHGKIDLKMFQRK